MARTVPPWKTSLPVITLIEVEPGIYELPRPRPQSNPPASRPVQPKRNLQPSTESEPLFLKLDHDFGKAGKALFHLYLDTPGAREQAIIDLLKIFFK